MRSSFAEILSGPVALFTSRDRSFFSTTSSSIQVSLNLVVVGVTRQTKGLGTHKVNAEAKL